MASKNVSQPLQLPTIASKRGSRTERKANFGVRTDRNRIYERWRRQIFSITLLAYAGFI